MTHEQLIDAVAKLINPELFQLPSEGQNPAYYRFVENEKAKATKIIGLVEEELVRS